MERPQTAQCLRIIGSEDLPVVSAIHVRTPERGFLRSRHVREALRLVARLPNRKTRFGGVVVDPNIVRFGTGFAECVARLPENLEKCDRIDNARDAVRNARGSGSPFDINGQAE